MGATMGHSKNHLSVRLRCQSLVRNWSVILCLTLTNLALSSRLFCQSDSMALKLRQNTVRIEVGDQDGQHGFGFVVGERDGFLYIATARHILAGSDIANSPSITTARVIFYSDQGNSYTANVLGTHSGDLAVLRLATPPGFRWIAECLAGPSASKRGTQVWFIGKRDEWYIPAQPGSLASEQPSTESLIEIDGLPVSPGTSGAPLIAITGITGMIQKDFADDTRALTIDFIQQAIQRWNYPWGLKPT